MPAVQIGIAVPEIEDSDVFRERIRKAEASGVTSFWTYDHGRGADAFARAGFVAAITTEARICMGVVNPFIRHPAVLASGAATVDRLSRGRATLAIGAGWKPWVEHVLGVPRREPFAAVRDAVRVVRALLRGERVSFEGNVFTLRNAKLAIDPIAEVPIYLAGGGRIGIDTAADVADGHLCEFHRAHDAYLAWLKERIVARRGSLTGFDIVVPMALKIVEDADTVLPRFKRSLAWVFSVRYGEPYFELVGVERRIVDRVRQATRLDAIIETDRDPEPGCGRGGPRPRGARDTRRDCRAALVRWRSSVR